MPQESQSDVPGETISVKAAVTAVQAFIKDLFGPEQLRYTRLEEIELNQLETEWLVTMSLSSSTNVIFSPNERDFRTFRVDANTGRVISMKARK